MKVILKRHFFGDRLYRRNGDKVVEIPDRYKNRLPKGSKVVEETPVIPAKKAKQEE